MIPISSCLHILLCISNLSLSQPNLLFVGISLHHLPYIKSWVFKFLESYGEKRNIRTYELCEFLCTITNKLFFIVKVILEQKKTCKLLRQYDSLFAYLLKKRETSYKKWGKRGLWSFLREEYIGFCQRIFLGRENHMCVYVKSKL